MKQVYDVRARVVESKYVDKKAKAAEKVLHIVDLIIFWVTDAWATLGMMYTLSGLTNLLYEYTGILDDVYNTTRFTVFMLGVSVMLTFYLVRFGLKKLHKVIVKVLGK